MRAFLPQELQRFSIDLDFYSIEPNVHNVLARIENSDLNYAGYGAESEGIFKRYESPIPSKVEKCTIALIKRYRQAFGLGGLDPEFYVTISNTFPSIKWDLRKPKSYIGIDYVKEVIPILSPNLIIASKIRALPTRKIKDFYKDIFDIHALFDLSDVGVDETEITSALSAPRLMIQKSEVYDKFRETSSEENAKTAIRLPRESKNKYLADWKHTNSAVKEMTLRVLEKVGALQV